MRVTSGLPLAAAAALLAGAHAAADSSAASSAPTSTSTVQLPLVTGMPLAASVINADKSGITYRVECNSAATGSEECHLPPVTITEIDQKTYQGQASQLGVDISLSCASAPKSQMVCSNSIGGVVAGLGSMLGDFVGQHAASASASVPSFLTAAGSGGGLFGLPATVTYDASSIGDVVVAITAGVEKLADATAAPKTTKASATATGTATGTADATADATASGAAETAESGNAGLPRATGSAGMLAGGALAAFALAF
ncbi:hypothetical protein KEM52_000225 [Ascosphaera acerosa]|nr:hypothetical protein KEM52_000225 [Ascosphaera acerosa]